MMDKTVSGLDSPDQVTVRGDTISTALWYPRTKDSKIQHVQIALIDVRAADPIRIRFDFDRSGYVVERCILDGEEDSNYRYREVAFVAYVDDGGD